MPWIFFTNLEAVESRSRSLKLLSIDGLFESRKSEKLKGSNIVSCVQRKYFSYIIGKIVLLRRNFSKAWFILSWFLLLFLLFLLMVSAFHSILKLFKVSYFASLLYKYMKTWYFHSQYKASGFHVSKVATHF